MSAEVSNFAAEGQLSFLKSFVYVFEPDLVGFRVENLALTWEYRGTR